MAKKRITKVYTKTGDKGRTSLADGSRVDKFSPRVKAYGDVDELNSVIGIAVSRVRNTCLKSILTQLQNDLFILGSDLATPDDFAGKVPRVSERMIGQLEEHIDEFHAEVGDLKEFILPSGIYGTPYIHHARTVCRRAERNLVELSEKHPVNSMGIKYLNRLSDLLFMMARIENKRASCDETLVDFGKGPEELK